MKSSLKLPAALVAVIAIVLSTTGVVLAATDSNPHGYSADPLSLHGYAPKSADIQITISANSSALASGDLQVDFRHSAGHLTLGSSVGGFGAQLQMILASQHVYLVNGGTADRPYVNLGKVGISWIGVSFEMAHPQVNLLALLGAVHDALSTNAQGEKVHTLKITGKNLSLGSGLSIQNATSIEVTVGRGGELTGITVHVRSKHSAEDIALRVISYNQPVKVTTPLPSQISTQMGNLNQLLKMVGISSALKGLKSNLNV